MSNYKDLIFLLYYAMSCLDSKTNVSIVKQTNKQAILEEFVKFQTYAATGMYLYL